MAKHLHGSEAEQAGQYRSRRNHRRMLEHEPQLVEEIAGCAVDAQQMRHLADNGDADQSSINPRITGVGMKAATHPMRSAPNSRKNAPIRMARVEVSVLKCAVPGMAMAPTVSAEMRPVAVSGPTTSWREVPSSA